MRRIERDPEPWEYSEHSFSHLVESLRRAEDQERHDDAPAINWSAVKGAAIGISFSLVFWWVFIWTVLYVHGLLK